MKKLLTSAFIIATIALGAQNQKMKKACIKIDMEENGKVTKIDTCVTAATDAELQEKLNALGFGNPPTPPVPPVPPLPPGAEISIEIDSLPGDGYEYTYTKVISIDDEEGGKEGKKSGESSKGVPSAKKKKVVSKSNKHGDAHVIVMDGEGNVITTDSEGKDGDAKVVVKHLEPGEKMDEEMEKIMKEHGIDKEKGEARQVIIKNHKSKNGKENKEVKVYVFSKMEVKKLSEAEKKKLPAEASKALAGGKTFENLNVSPNPTEDTCTISYKANSKEPLQIKAYNAEGKTVLTETETGTGDQVNKTLSLKGLGQGTYFVHLTQGKQSEVRKVIVK